MVSQALCYPNTPQGGSVCSQRGACHLVLSPCRSSFTACFDPGVLSLLPAQHRFSLDKDTGLIVLIARLDYELIQRFTLTVIARDGGGEETTGRVRINVLDVNDNVPTFQKDAYVGALRENEPSVTQLVRLRVRPGTLNLSSLSLELLQEVAKLPPTCQGLL